MCASMDPEEWKAFKLRSCFLSIQKKKKFVVKKGLKGINKSLREERHFHFLSEKFTWKGE